MSASKPVILFVTGAWHTPKLYSPFLDGLKNLGYTVLAPHLPSVGGSMDSTDEDVALLRQTIQDQMDHGQEIVVIMHSYGGIAGSAAVEGLAKTAGAASGVTKLIFIAAFALDEGQSLTDALGGSMAPWILSANEKQWKASDTKTIFYNDLDDSVARDLDGQLVYQAKGCFVTKLKFAAWKHIDSAYIICNLDNAIPAPAQEGMASQPGNKFSMVERMETSHTPFVSRPQETINLVLKAMGQ